jgi:short-subunit dehydrogenase
MPRVSGERFAVFGATSGIAQAVARLLVARGCGLVLVGRNRERLESVAADLRARGAASVRLVVADLADCSDHARVMDEVGEVDAALVAHGVLGDQALAERDFDHARRILDTNFTSAASLALRLASLFERRGRGRLVVVGSVAGDRGRKSNYVYGASKAAVDMLMQGLRHRLAGTGVQVLTIKPGIIDTPMTAHLPRSPLFASAERAARGIVAAMDGHASVAYVPGVWRWIMAVIRRIPDRVFHKTNL